MKFAKMLKPLIYLFVFAATSSITAESLNSFLRFETSPINSEFCKKYLCTKIDQYSSKIRNALTYSMKSLPNSRFEFAMFNFPNSPRENTATLTFFQTFDSFSNLQQVSVVSLIKSATGSNDGLDLYSYCNSVEDVFAPGRDPSRFDKIVKNGGATYSITCLKFRAPADNSTGHSGEYPQTSVLVMYNK